LDIFYYEFPVLLVLHDALLTRLSNDAGFKLPDAA